MIPKIIHYCWFGRGEMPEEAKKCIASWHKYMPDYEYKLWNEDNFDVDTVPYAREAYSAKKYAFVSDYVRLWALANTGGIYFDTDVEVLRPFDELLDHKAFAGFEGSKQSPLGTCVMASEPNGEWIKEQLDNYKDRHFINDDGTLDLTTNVDFITYKMVEQGFVQNGMEQEYKDLHVFPVEYFSPRMTTWEYNRTDNTYSDHLGLGSWTNKDAGWKVKLGRIIGNKNMTRLIRIKRKITK
ncbi:MAG: glycosyl transferase [Bacteroidales bacterium]|nr:glycosyl transferase [Bacteroidales bacterium]